MSEHLLAISIGPVQDFIAAARRTRDLWFGSHVLSEISKAAAKAVADQVGLDALIFPAPEAADELLPLDTEATLAVANVILARLPSGTVPADVAKVAKQAAESRWRELANDARKEAKQRAVQICEDVWHDQVDDVVEFYSAWAELPSVVEYRETRKLVMRLLAGRKACHNFVMAKGRAKLPKSSLDGARETVLDSHTKGSGRLPLADGEQLDVVGLTKRLAGGGQSYPSVARIAADPWLRTLADSEPHASSFARLKAVCKQLVDKELLRCSEMPSATFPYDGTAIFLNRHTDLAKESGQEKSVLEPLADVVGELTRPFSRDGLGQPSPYLAILVADGDRMGAAISEIRTPEDHQRFSRELSSFAERARQIVRDANGVCVYAGGDDVLAFAPLDSCLSCARELHSAFCTMMGGWKTSEDQSPTLSVGIAIGHFMEPLEDLLGFGRAAEQAAKKSVELGGTEERNALAVVVRTRGAAPISVRDNWKQCDDDAALDQRLIHWAELFANGSLPNKLAYELRQLVAVYERWPTETISQRETLQKVLGKDVRRLLKRKQTDLVDEERDDDGDLKRRDRRFLNDRVDSIKSVAALKSLAEELLIAQQISGALPQKSESHRKQLQKATR
jgi:CRISPR-associated protein Cmr2